MARLGSEQGGSTYAPASAAKICPVLVGLPHSGGRLRRRSSRSENHAALRQSTKRERFGCTSGSVSRSTYRFRIRRTIQTAPTIAAIHGARNAIATPIIRKLHMIPPALWAIVRRRVAISPVSDETIFPWL